MNFSYKILEEIGKYYFKNSLQYFPERYIPLLLESGSKVPKHVAYLCPICLEQAIMIVDAPSHPLPEEFTEDHYPPKSVGGKKTVLVCRQCNSKAGHEYDHALVDHLRHLSFERRIPNSEIKTMTAIPEVGKFKGRMIIDEQSEVRVDLKRNESDKIKPLDEWIEYSKVNNDWKINLRFNSPHNEKVEKALLHAAYLTCFEFFGYEYLFSPGGQMMRNALQNVKPYPANVVDLNLDSDYMLEHLPLGLIFINHPKDLQCMAVNLKLTAKETGYSTIKTVLIPPPTKDGIEKLKEISHLLVSYIGDVSMTPLKNFLQTDVLPPYRTMWAVLVRDYIQE